MHLNQRPEKDSVCVSRISDLVSLTEWHRGMPILSCSWLDRAFQSMGGMKAGDSQDV